MEEYIGVKRIKAKAMTREAYNSLRGWVLPKDENGDDEGYLVEYLNSGSNVEGFDGYISWSPSNVFDEAYKKAVDKVEASEIDALVNSLVFKYARIGDTTTTVCEAFLPNGFSVGSGKSACVNPDNYDFELGCKYAKENALSNATQELWKLEGYMLKTIGRTSK